VGTIKIKALCRIKWIVEEKRVFAYEKYVIKFLEIVNNEFKAFLNVKSATPLRNALTIRPK